MKCSKDLVNKIKKRERYRPFGGSVLEEYAKDYFDINVNDAFMLYTANVRRDELPGITHVDRTCRIQIVDRTNNTFRTLMEEFYKITGCPVLLNTSLNIAGKPLAGFPENAIELFKTTSLNAMFIGNDVLEK
jgi:carbamoyltransferase